MGSPHGQVRPGRPSLAGNRHQLAGRPGSAARLRLCHGLLSADRTRLPKRHGEALLRAFYGHGPDRSYFYGCSGGGRQALFEAQRYPADYDGIIAGAPGYSIARMSSLMLWAEQVTHANPGSYISPAKLAAIEAAALAACDANDGLKDGLIENPQ